MILPFCWCDYSLGLLLRLVNPEDLTPDPIPHVVPDHQRDPDCDEQRHCVCDH